MHGPFKWLSGLYGAFVIIYGAILLAKAVYHGHVGLHQGITDGLLIMSGFVILLLTRPRQVKTPPHK